MAEGASALPSADASKEVSVPDASASSSSSTKADPSPAASIAQGGGLSAANALDYLIFLVDVDRLFDIALATYDFEMTAMVGQRSQKDPKEYVPTLATFHAMPTHMSRYAIHLHLHEHRLALPHLLLALLHGEAGASKERFLEFIHAHQLHLSAILLLHHHIQQPPSLPTSSATLTALLDLVLKAYGDELCDRGDHEEGALMFLLAQQPGYALEAYRHEWNWKRMVVAAKQMAMTEPEMRAMCSSAVSTLQSLGRYADAAALLLAMRGPLFFSSASSASSSATPVAEQCDVSEPVTLLIRGRQWDEARYVATLLHLSEQAFLDLIRPALTSFYEQQKAAVVDRMQSFRRYHRRVVEVKASKLLHPVAEAEDEEGDDARSVFSDAGSMSSASSASSVTSQGSTTSSRQSRRRAKKLRKRKKRLSGKRGSPHEEEWLLVQMADLVPSPVLQQEIGSLVRALVEASLWVEATTLQTLFSDLLRVVRAGSGVMAAPLLRPSGLPDHPDWSDLEQVKSCVTRTTWKLNALVPEKSTS